jgi:hypothetical protein
MRRNKRQRHSITSSARASSVGGTSQLLCRGAFLGRLDIGAELL